MIKDGTLLEKARNFAKERHEGQFRRDGVTPYFDHCEKVASLVDSEFEKCMAYCHDLIENGKARYQEIDEEISKDLVNPIISLTNVKGVDYFYYIRSIKNDYPNDFYNEILKVKIADIVANLTDSPTPEQIKKYVKALNILAGVE